ncbi:MAG: peptidase, partial [Gemmatimonadetes bacterium]|nr:peptidase [Gemmatimonadota bacterium]
MHASLIIGLMVSALQSPQARDTTYERLIREATTDPRFLPATVATIPDHPSIPSPREHFGTIAGAPGVMHRSAELYGYYRALAQASPRVRFETVGRTEEERDLVLVTIADEATMAQLDRIKQGMAALADPRTTDRAAMEQLVGEIKPVYYLMGGLHSPEMGPPEMLIELAYRLAVSDDPLIQRIRNNVVVLINPVAEPDGRDRQVDWYYRYTKGRPELDDGFPRSSPYWGKYVFHDNNRDGIQISQQLTKAGYRTYYEWRPLVMHDLHESVPLLYVSTGTGPYNYTIDPIIVTEWQTLANWDIQSLTKQGVPGVWTWGFFDGWWPGYGAWAATNHNGISRFYETFGNSGADTYLRDLRGQTYAGDSVTTAQWYRPWPPTAKVRWSLRNNTNFMQGGVLASLDYAARNARDLLVNFWQKGFNSLERGRTRAPHAFLIPALDQQRDPRRAAYLVNQLRRHAIEVHRSTDTLPGSFVVKLDQPYRDLAVNLLTKQDYPSSARYPPYDDIAWTLGLLYGVEVQPVNDPKVLTWRGLEPLRDTVAWFGSVSRGTAAGAGNGSTESRQPIVDSWLLNYTGQAELLPALYALRQREARSAALVAETTFTASGREWTPGTVILEGLTATGADWLAQQYGLTLVQAAAPDVRRHVLDLPRVAIYHTWFSTQDEGWVRYWFDQLGIPYTSIHKDDVRAGNLRRRFDVILVPSAGGQGPQWIHEIDKKWGPLPYTKTAEFASHGTPSTTTDMTGGPGFLGMAELERFLDAGGTLITIENATRLATETGLVRELQEYQPSGLFHPGSIVTVKARRLNHPVLYGFPETTHVFRGNAPLWRTARRDRGMIVLQYGTEPLADERDTLVAEIMGMPGAAGAAGTPGAAEAGRAGGGGAAAGAAEEGGGRRQGAAAEESGTRPRGQPYVLSGMVRNNNQIVGHGAVFDVPAGANDAGRVIAFTF